MISDIEKPFLFSDLAVKTAKSENRKVFLMSEKTLIREALEDFVTVLR